jgi:hypothetical protein
MLFSPTDFPQSLIFQGATHSHPGHPGLVQQKIFGHRWKKPGHSMDLNGGFYWENLGKS